jgi:CHAT domain-containing protein
MLFVLAAIATLASWLSFPSQATLPPALASGPTPQALLQQGKANYDAGQWSAAIQVLQQARQAYEAQGDRLGVAIAASNLALVYQQVGQWPEALSAIARSLQELESPDLAGRLPLLAQALDIQGRLQLSQGQAEAALMTWEKAAQLYDQLGDRASLMRNRVNQAEAMQALGFYRRAITTLTQLTDTTHEPASLTQVVALRSLGDALRIAGDLNRSRQVLQQSLEMAQRLGGQDAIAATQLSLGNTVYSQGDTQAALSLYQAAARTDSLMTVAQAQLNQLRLFADTGRWQEAEALLPQVTTQIDRLSASRATIYAHINVARTLIQLDLQGRASSRTGVSAPSTRFASALPQAAHVLAAAIQQAEQLGDGRARSLALGTLGGVYEQTQQWTDALEITQQAIALAQQLNAADITYLWAWQLGRIHKAMGKPQEAIAAYTDAVEILRSLRKDLVAINPEVQFSFRESVEPIHRQLVALLLDTSNGRDPNQEQLEQARQVIESLQLAELDNFFREACLDAQPTQIDQIDPQAAVIYPIILPDRLEVVISLPQATAAGGSSESAKPLLRHYTTSNLTPNQVAITVDNLLQFLTSRASNRRVLSVAQVMYDWLIRPAEVDLAQRQIKTLVFVLDGVLRNIPMAVLHDGNQYLVERYNIALTPTLQLLASQSLRQNQLSVLVGGLTEGRQGFSALPNVTREVQKIQAELPGQVLLNQQFTNTALQAAINASPYPVVHLATHGEFSSRLEDTFILTWDGRITINQLNALLQTSDINRRHPIELLVLSACQTAEGDERAALGLAGVAVRAGARSTLATLWSVSDEATPILMEEFYQALAKGNTTKAAALRQAQLALLHNPQFQRPFFWGPFVLVGNWL